MIPNTVIANGCFDGPGLHPGHLHLLGEARAMGDRLVVLVNSDASVRALKGDGRPLLPLKQRMYQLQCCRFVDMVLPFDSEEELSSMIALIQPTVLVKGGDWRGKPITGGCFCRVEFVERLAGWSTTEVIERANGNG